MAITIQNTGSLVMQDARQLLGLAREWLRQGNAGVALGLLEDALARPEVARDSRLEAELTRTLGSVFMRTGQWDRAEDACQRAANTFIKEGIYGGAAESIRNLANLKFQLGKFNESYALCEEAIELSSRTDDAQLRATILNTQGAIKSIEGNHRESIKIFKLCFSDFERSGNRKRQAHILHNIGLACYELEDYTESKRAFEQALALALQNGDTCLVEICYQNMAKLFLRLGELAVARSLIKSARELLEMLKSPALKADLAIVESLASRLSGDLNEAQRIIEEGLILARENRLLQHEGEMLYEAGLIAIERGDSSLARARLEAAITVLKNTGGGLLEKAVGKLKNLKAAAKRQITAGTSAGRAF